MYSWKQEHPDEYSRFSVEMMKVECNDFSCLERIFKIAAGFVLTSVLIECRKLLAPDSEEVLSADERAVAASRVVDELMGRLSEVWRVHRNSRGKGYHWPI